MSWSCCQRGGKERLPTLNPAAPTRCHAEKLSLLLPLGQALLLGAIGITKATTAVLLKQTPAVAQDASEVARFAMAITIRIEGATQGQGSGGLVKREGNRYTVLTAWHVVSGNRPGEDLIHLKASRQKG